MKSCTKGYQHIFEPFFLVWSMVHSIYVGIPFSNTPTVILEFTKAWKDIVYYSGIRKLSNIVQCFSKCILALEWSLFSYGTLLPALLLDYGPSSRNDHLRGHKLSMSHSIHICFKQRIFFIWSKWALITIHSSKTVEMFISKISKHTPQRRSYLTLMLTLFTIKMSLMTNWIMAIRPPL